ARSQDRRAARLEADRTRERAAAGRPRQRVRLFTASATALGSGPTAVTGTSLTLASFFPRRLSMPNRVLRFGVTVAILGLVPGACAARQAPPGPRASAPSVSPAATSHQSHKHPGLDKIDHLIFVVMENRSFDSYFGTYPGADGIPQGVCVPDPVV